MEAIHTNQLVRRKFRIGEYTILFLIAALFLLLTLTSDTFCTYNNLYSLLYGVSIQFFAVIGFTLLIIMGEIDLAVGSMYGLSGTLVGFCMTVWKWKLLPSSILVLLVCAAFGWCIGALVTRFKLNSMMVTLGSLSFVSGVNAVVFNSFTAVTYNAEYRALAKFKLAGVHWSILAMVALVIVLEFLLKKTPAFKKFYYIGNSQETARLYGVKSDRYKRVAFTISALTAAIGGIIATSRITHSDVLTGSGLEFTLITGLVVAGASLAGGRGGILKAALGMIFIAMLANGMTIYRIDPFIQQVMQGIVLIVAVFLDVRMNSKKA
ncbi:MAG TPA: ABC transporter permease [Candidatus Cryosericum sp.]|nr:ABC transporter permease [Candidatus Cryosericum sp.]